MISQSSGSARVVVGVDGSPAAAAALRWAIAEARLRNLLLHVVQVNDDYVVVPPGHVSPPADGIAAGDRARAESALAAQVSEAIGLESGPRVQLELADGLPVRVLLDRAAGAALLVLGSSRPSPSDGGPASKLPVPLGPVARGCLRAAPCPVVVVTGQQRSREANEQPPRVVIQ